MKPEKFRCPNCSRLWLESKLSVGKYPWTCTCGWWVQSVHDLRTVTQVMRKLQKERTGISFDLAYDIQLKDDDRLAAEVDAAYRVSVDVGRAKEAEHQAALDRLISKVRNWPLRKWARAAREGEFEFVKRGTTVAVWGSPNRDQWCEP